MDLNGIIYILVGSTCGLFLRFFIKNNFKKKIGLNLDNISKVNILSSLLLGTLVAFNSINKNLFFLFYVGFLGCFSTFSSFIYELFNLIQSRKYLQVFYYYIEVLMLSFLFFFLGYSITVIIKN